MFGKEEAYQLNKLRVGFTFKHKKITWEVIEVAEYSWRGEGMSTEYKVKDLLNNIAFFEVEFYHGDYELYFSKEIHLILEEMTQAIESGFIEVQGVSYELEEQYKGTYKNLTVRSSRESLESFLFYKGSNMITIEKWSDGSYESFAGYEFKKKQIKNIKSNEKQ